MGTMDYEIPIAYATPVEMMPPPMSTVEGAPASSMTQSYGVSLSSGRRDIDERQIRELQAQGFTRGLAKALACNIHALRIWVVDNSGSMSATDGHRFIETKHRTDIKIAQCTRWAEIQETVQYHAQMAALLHAPTVFRMLNNPGSAVGPQEFGVADKGSSLIESDLQLALHTIRRASPGGVTPLSNHIRQIRLQILEMAAQLRSEGRKVTVILATDGLPSDDTGAGGERQQAEFVTALRSLEGLPVWIVVRLCTDDDAVVDFYNNLDAQLELSIEVLDDFMGEGMEIHKTNNWLNYTLAIHRCREMGFQNRLFDLLDERTLTRGELYEFCVLLFGEEQFDGVPDPEANFEGFLMAIKQMTNNEKKQWNPVTKKVTSVLDIDKVKSQYGEGGCIIS